MKLSKPVIKQFEQDQKVHGTKVALYNVIWVLAAELFKDIGVKRIRAS